jgi:hypothetical protein
MSSLSKCWDVSKVQRQRLKKTSVVISRRSWIASEPVCRKANQTARLCSANSCNGALSRVGGDGDAVIATLSRISMPKPANNLVAVLKEKASNAYFSQNGNHAGARPS